jgi:hypothetical protein
MTDRAAKVASVAVGSGVLSVIGFVSARSLDFFAPCRVLYRVSQAVQDSLACQSYSAISLASLLFVLAALGFAVTTAVLIFPSLLPRSGFVAIGWGDGSENEEGCPDVLRARRRHHPRRETSSLGRLQ